MANKSIQDALFYEKKLLRNKHVSSKRVISLDPLLCDNFHAFKFRSI